MEARLIRKQVAGCELLVAGCELLVAGCELLVAHRFHPDLI